MKAASSFVVSRGAIRLRIKVMPSIRAVGAAYYRAKGSGCTVDARGVLVYAFFESAAPRSRYTGTIFLCENTRLFEVVPHEVVHACLHHFKNVSTEDDEKFAMAVGCLTANILTKLDGE